MLMDHPSKYCMLPTVWAQKLNRLDDSKNFQFCKRKLSTCFSSQLILKHNATLYYKQLYSFPLSELVSQQCDRKNNSITNNVFP